MNKERNRYQSSRKYREKHREEFNKRSMEYYLKHKEEIRAKFREKYRNDTEFRERYKKQMREWFSKNKDKIRRTRRRRSFQPYTTGLECICGFPIKCYVRGRLGKRIIKCPKCGMETQRKELKKVRIPREIPVALQINPMTINPNHNCPSNTSFGFKSRKDNWKGVKQLTRGIKNDVERKIENQEEET